MEWVDSICQIIYETCFLRTIDPSSFGKVNTSYECFFKWLYTIAAI